MSSYPTAKIWGLVSSLGRNSGGSRFGFNDSYHWNLDRSLGPDVPSRVHRSASRRVRTPGLNWGSLPGCLQAVDRLYQETTKSATNVSFFQRWRAHVNFCGLRSWLKIVNTWTEPR